MNMNIRTMTSSKTPSVAEDSAAKKHLGDRRCTHHFSHDVPGQDHQPIPATPATQPGFLSYRIQNTANDSDVSA